MKRVNKKHYGKAVFQIFLLLSLTFSVSYLIRESSENVVIINYEKKNYDLEARLLGFVGKLIFGEGFVSALEVGDLQDGSNTCLLSKDGKICQEYIASECDSKCSETCIPTGKKNVASCKPGTCYNPVEGACSAGATQGACSANGGEWFDDPYENIQECREGCCLIGGQAKFLTEQQCNRQSQLLNIDKEFRPDVRTEIQCLDLGTIKEEGACVFEKEFERTCKFTDKSNCLKIKGDFYSGKLCSNPELDTICEPQKTTNCVDGKNEVYWFDSCGNRENIYSVPKAGSFKNGEVLSKIDSCTLSSGNNQLANANTCGNCNYLLGSTCGRVSDGEKVAVGDFICKDLSCIDESGVKREHGESWCSYQGTIGVDKQKNRAVDTPGSRHFRETCVNGEIEVNPCADYRNEICVESQIKIPSGEFSSAACRINRAQECLSYNFEGDKDDIDRSDKIKSKCEKNPDCFVKEVDVSDKFNFNICAPKYPSGFTREENGRGEGAEAICAIANQKCQYVKVKGLFSSKEVNKECLQPEFAEEMNDLCMSLGDCGSSVNYNGDYTSNYKITRTDNKDSASISQTYLNALLRYGDPIKGQYAEAGDLSDFYGELGIPGMLGTSEVPTDTTEGVVKMASLTSGMLGVTLMAANFLNIAIPGLTYSTGAVISTMPIAGSAGEISVVAANPGMMAAGGVLAGAAIGLGVVTMLLQFTGVGGGLPPAVTYTLMAAGAIGGALAGAAATASALTATGGTVGPLLGGLASAGPIGWIILVVVVIFIIILKILGIGKAKKVDVQFQCKIWEAPTGGTNCDECGKDGFPCSRYACQSLGQTCSIINENTREVACIDSNPNDVTPPVIKPWNDLITQGHSYNDISENGFKLESEQGCLKPYTQLVFGVSLNEPGRCMLASEDTDKFEDMTEDFGVSQLFRTNHTAIFPVPDLQSLGLQGYDPKLQEDYSLFLRCEDKSGNSNVKEYEINFCIGQADNFEAPIIQSREPNSEFLKFGVSSQKVDIYVNEPSECKWDVSDKEYILMGNDMICENDLEDQTIKGWKCSDKFPISNGAGNYYVRCKDQPWLANQIKSEDDESVYVDNPKANESKRNVNSESYLFSLKESVSELKIDPIVPNGQKLEFGVEPASVEVIVSTSGGMDGTAKCSYLIGGHQIDFVDTWKKTSKQVFQTLYPGNVNLPIVCEDLVGNKAEGEANFDIKLDVKAPSIARIYVESGNLKTVSDEKAQCVYSAEIPESGFSGCKYDFVNGTSMITNSEGRVHSTSFESAKTYYIKCKDEFGWTPGSNRCSAIVKRGTIA
ncbi:hypothetical protein COU54_05455 [Candidatus Pacearchaeota archaeon CG10_big_fil_rev_8_21_14_0_10_31_24]|nr:MAG: hypothetical protein COU54_05455 [Candidatus Pacearchaeota archaeon CG10_big_fil_rev_8_21_14_0_10_31_24]